MLACHLQARQTIATFLCLSHYKTSQKIWQVSPHPTAVICFVDIHSTVPASTRTAWVPKSDALSTGVNSPVTQGTAVLHRRG